MRYRSRFLPKILATGIVPIVLGLSSCAISLLTAFPDVDGRQGTSGNNFQRALIYTLSLSGSIEVWQADLSTGLPSFVSSVTTRSPKALATDPAGRFLFVTNGSASTTSAYSIDAASGSLSSVGGPFASSGQPSCVASEPSGHFLYNSASVALLPTDLPKSRAGIRSAWLFIPREAFFMSLIRATTASTHSGFKPAAH